MRLTQEQFQSLSPYERNFTTAIKARWSSYPGQNGVRLMHEILCEVTGTRRPLSMSCGACILELVTDLGKIYFADKAEMENDVTKGQSDKNVPVSHSTAEAKPKAIPKKKAAPKKKQDAVRPVK